MSEHFKGYFDIEPKRTPGAEQAAKLIEAIECTVAHPYACIVFEDVNIDDDNIDAAINGCRTNHENLPPDEVDPVLAALLAMKALDYDERATAIGIADGWLGQ